MVESVERREAEKATGPPPARRDHLTLRTRMVLCGSRQKNAQFKTTYVRYRWCERLSRQTVNYANTVNNLTKALLTRVYIDCPPWAPPRCSRRLLRQAATRMGRQLSPELDEAGIEEALSRFPPAKRQLYQEGLSKKLDIGVHSRVTSFVKQENVPYKEADKPRAIQFRNPAFLAHMLSFYKPLEHVIYRGRYIWNKHQKFTCAKGMSPMERMSCLKDMVRGLNAPLSVSLDGSAFDAHVVEEALKAEWLMYDLAMKEAGYRPATLAKARAMGKAQLRNSCSARLVDGTVSYKRFGGRGSGDLNTGGGNSLLSQWFIASIMEDLRVPEAEWRMLVDGDDCVFMVSKQFSHVIPQLQASFARFSQEVKVENVSEVTLDTLEVLEFCQARPVNVDGTWRLIRNPRKVYNGYNAVVAHYNTIEQAQRFWAAVAQPELIYAAGVPILEELFLMFHRLSGDARPCDSANRRFWIRALKSMDLPKQEFGVSFNTRESFEKAFGFTIAEQLSIEDELRSWLQCDLSEADVAVPQLRKWGLASPAPLL